MLQEPFHGQLQPVPLEVRPCEDATRGRGAFATRAIAAGELIFTEQPLVFAVALDAAHIPACACCLASLSPNPFGPRLPRAACWPPPRALRCAAGCPALYCAPFCRDRDRARGHARLCRGRRAGPPPATAAYDLLLRHCRDGLPECWEPVRHLPLVSLRFCSLLLEERRVAAPAAGRLAVVGARGAACPASVAAAALQPAQYPVAAVLAEMCGSLAGEAAGTRLDMLVMYPLVRDALGLSEEEQCYIDPAALAGMLAKLCRNCSHIRPMSAFHQYMAETREERGREAHHDSLVALQALAREVLDGESAGDAHARPASDVDVGGIDSFYAERTGVSAGAFYPLHSKMNHSCDSNAAAVSGGFYDATMDVVATKNIASGAEVVISYTSAKLTSSQKRRALLNDHLFVCMCIVCVPTTTSANAAGLGLASAA